MIMFICVCKAVTAQELQELLAKGELSAQKISEQTGAGSDCGSCLSRLNQFVQGLSKEESASPLALTSDKAS